MSPTKKMGRPKSDNPKEHDIKVRLDNKTHEKILNYCKSNHITKAEAIRRGINLLLKNKKD